MKLLAVHYLEAAQERRDEAWHLYENGRYVGALYLTGVAVECLLRAYRVRRGLPFQARHNLIGLYQESGLMEFINERNRERLAADLGEVWSRWKNDYRYASEKRLRAEINRRERDRRTKGDLLKWNARIAWDSGSYVIATGVAAWTYKRN